jgi:uncharacterized protein YkwD
LNTGFERREFERVAVREEIIIFDGSERRIGPLLDAGNGGMAVRLEDAGAIAQFHPGEQFEVTVVKPKGNVRQSLGVVVRNISNGRLGLEFVNHHIGRAVLALCLLGGLGGATSKALAAPAPVPPSTATRTSSQPFTAPEVPYALFTLINQTRTRAGLPQLSWDDGVAHAALGHAQVMAGKKSLSHQFDGEPELGARLAASAVRMDRASENVVYDVNVQSAHENFLSSEHHKANILDPEVDTVGIGVAEAGGVLYITEDFTHHVVDTSDEQAEQQIAAAFTNLRQSAGGAPMQFVAEPRLREVAQNMAKNEVPDAAMAMAVLNGRSVAAYATRTPGVLPASVVGLGAAQGVNRFSVGACFARTAKYPNGFYWVTIVLL